jgi:uncharacterized OsmC-like protein
MDAETLKATQAPIKESYKLSPEKAVITLRAVGELGSDKIACKVDTGRALIEAGLHPATGGDGSFACSGDMLLEALAACAGVTLKAVSTALAFDLKGGTVTVGFREIRLDFKLDTPEPQERIDTLLKLTERYCVVLQSIQKPPQFTARIHTV